MKESFLPFILFFLTICAVVFSKPRYVSGKTIRIFRVLFPSWRFFEEVCELPDLYYRTRTTQTAFGEWKSALPKLRRNNLSMLFFNPQGNLLLALHGAVQQLMTEVSELEQTQTDEVQVLVSYQLVERLVAYRARAELGLHQAFEFQFKICARLQGLSDIEAEDVLLSKTHEAKC